MSTSDAQFYFLIILSVAFLVWMTSLWFALRIGQNRVAAWQDTGKYKGASGEVPLMIPREEFFPRIRKVLRYQAANIPMIKFSREEETSSSAVYKRLGPKICNLPAGLAFSDVKFEAVTLQGRDVVRFQLNQDPVVGALRKIALVCCLFVGIPFMFLLSVLIWFFCVQSPNEMLRYQVIQLLHLFHGLWPPFLLVTISSQVNKAAKFYVSSMVEHAADKDVDESELSMGFVRWSTKRR
ncbi:MAG: hypothetical protein AB8B50_02630 [Pirellulaceae bacterium]